MHTGKAGGVGAWRGLGGEPPQEVLHLALQAWPWTMSWQQARQNGKWNSMIRFGKGCASCWEGNRDAWGTSRAQKTRL